MNIIIYTNDSGGVSVCYPTGELSIEAVQAKDTPVGSIIVDDANLPNTDVDFFDAWELNNGAVAVNFEKAKDLTKRRLRVERAPLLAAQDVLSIKNIEAGLDNSAVVAEKQRLRDITQLVDSCSTLGELRLLKA